MLMEWRSIGHAHDAKCRSHCARCTTRAAAQVAENAAKRNAMRSKGSRHQRCAAASASGSRTERTSTCCLWRRYMVIISAKMISAARSGSRGMFGRELCNYLSTKHIPRLSQYESQEILTGPCFRVSGKGVALRHTCAQSYDFAKLKACRRLHRNINVSCFSERCTCLCPILDRKGWPRQERLSSTGGIPTCEGSERT
jgi:hypothetical protein